MFSELISDPESNSQDETFGILTFWHWLEPPPKFKDTLQIKKRNLSCKTALASIFRCPQKKEHFLQDPQQLRKATVRIDEILSFEYLPLGVDVSFGSFGGLKVGELKHLWFHWTKWAAVEGEQIGKTKINVD